MHYLLLDNRIIKSLIINVLDSDYRQIDTFAYFKGLERLNFDKPVYQLILFLILYWQSKNTNTASSKLYFM